MKIYQEISLKDFEFWAGAKPFAARLTEEEFDCIEEALAIEFDEDMPSDMDINNMFWFDQDAIAFYLNTTADEILERERSR